MKKRFISIVLAVCLCVSLLPVMASAAAVTSDKVVEYMNSKVGKTNNYVGYCLLFVSKCWEELGFKGSYGWGTAKNFADSNTVSKSKDNIPIGADVFFYDSKYPEGHIGIYIGDGWFVHAGSKTVYEKTNLFTNSYYSSHYAGWGWHPYVTVTASSGTTPTSSSTKVSQHYWGSDYNEGWYEGEWANSKPNGYGKLTYDDFADGKYYSLIAEDGKSYKAIYYEGNFKDGYRVGYGTMYYEGGYKEEGTYYGQWTASKTVFDGKRWKTTTDSEGYWPMRSVATSSSWANDTFGDWVYTKKPEVKVTSVSLTCSALTMKAGDTTLLSAAVQPSDASNKNVTWESSNTNVVIVNNGSVTAVSAGTAVITAKAGDKAAKCTVTVEDKSGNTAPEEFEDEGETEIADIAVFTRVNVYHQRQFSDVPANQWYTKSVASAFEYGLMKGTSSTRFNPYGNVTVAEAITIAARIHSIYTTGSENFIQKSDEPWHKCYIDYAYKNGIITYAYYNSNVEMPATRAQFAEIFACALPDKALPEINNIKRGQIPDISLNSFYAASVYKLYRAGILTGGDANGTFSPDTYITRAESAAIASRMADATSRVAFSLGK